MNEKKSEAGVERRSQARERLIDVAQEIIAAQGLAGLKARDLAAAAGCALGAIYTAFDDLDELILRVNARTLERLDAELNSALGDAEAEQALQAMARTYLNFARREEPSWRALFEHRLPPGVAPPQWYLDARNRLFNRLDMPLSQLLPGTNHLARAAFARTLFSAVHGVVALGLDEKIAETPPKLLDEQLEKLVRILADGLMMESARLL
ncbi:TetR/AcrR family transcriptional regulator [Methylocystis sp. L43]|uniref:TetR/AcrR family transcriptional regulator n=1 Tax=unclassified Methylocystis TaxID=2625913 RepID=UPI0018C2B703|nr:MULTISPECIES: TetR/AcrR family transcriptional regulator [unclassified Methylocystis]MBG0796542.1 TetR/AcrR family transcriptional regulator [Methylocystis sp. L43]MBG0804422.1 TetR/AcrR family transcriptional regulator [Methylocystis sp. H15]